MTGVFHPQSINVLDVKTGWLALLLNLSGKILNIFVGV